MHKNQSFFVHQKADEDLEAIFGYSLEKFGFARAARYIKDIEIMFEQLACNPQKGNTFDIQAVFNPASDKPTAALKPEPPAPRTTTSYS